MSLRRGLAAAWLLVLIAEPRPAHADWIRVAWDPNTEREVAGYRVFVGTSPRVYTETFDLTSRQTLFVYTAAEPGRRYYFAVAAMAAGGALSPLSQEVSGFGRRVGKGLPPPAPLADGSGTPAGTQHTVCSGGTGSPCFSASPVASDLGDVGAVAGASDGRLFFIEDGQRVRIVSDAGVSQAAALEGAAGTKLSGLALHPDFARTRFVYLAEIASRRAGPELHVVRYREVNGVLGEGAALVSLRLAAPVDVPVTVDGDGRIYLAFPAAAGGARDPYAGQVLRYSAEGRPDGAADSPVLVSGYARPGAAAWDAARGALWLTGADPASASVHRVTGPAPTSSAIAAPAPSATLALSGNQVVLGGEAGQIYSAAVDAGGAVGEWREIPLGLFPASTVRVTAAGSRLFAVVSDEAVGAARSSSILELRPR